MSGKEISFTCQPNNDEYLYDDDEYLYDSDWCLYDDDDYVDDGDEYLSDSDVYLYNDLGRVHCVVDREDKALCIHSHTRVTYTHIPG